MSVFKPAQRLMGRLSYTGKFLLVSALFGIPLLVLTGQLLVGQFQELRAISQIQDSATRFRQLTVLIHDLERVRDLAPLQATGTPTQAARDSYQQALSKARDQLQRLETVEADSPTETARIANLKRGLANPNFYPGSEAFRAEQVWESANQLVTQAYEWQYLVATDAGLQAIDLPGLDQVSNLMLKTLPRVQEHLGMARSMGDYFLFRQYVDTGSVRLLEQTWRNIDSDIQRLDGIALQNTVAQQLQQSMIRAASRIRGLFDQHLIQVIELDTPWTAYDEAVTDEIDAIQDSVFQALDALDNSLQTAWQSQRNHLLLAATGLLALLLLIVYLLIGFYRTVKRTVTGLRDAAKQVAGGHYDQPITVTTQDELQQLAESLDEMRRDLREREALLRDFSLRDGLTGLRNRYYFDEALATQMSIGQRQHNWLSLLLIDLDHFKRVNDTYGHLAGDAVLKHAAQCFRDSFKRKTDILARFGGEEFAIILPDTDLATAAELAEKIRHVLQSSPIRFESQQINYTASIGVAAIQPVEGQSDNELIAAADAALYRAKTEGRNRIATAGKSEHTGTLA
ncbi:GGDEF domain-containing protein [Marinobacteraceae bacterium S3BR75-40.1]